MFESHLRWPKEVGYEFRTEITLYLTNIVLFLTTYDYAVELQKYYSFNIKHTTMKCSEDSIKSRTSWIAMSQI